MNCQLSVLNARNSRFWGGQNYVGVFVALGIMLMDSLLTSALPRQVIHFLGLLDPEIGDIGGERLHW